jgi:hypothetical protein
MEIFHRLINTVAEYCQNELPDNRTGDNKVYSILDGVMSLFLLRFSQVPSTRFFEFWLKSLPPVAQNNLKNLFKISKKPTFNQVINLLDNIDPSTLLPLFQSLLKDALNHKEFKDKYLITLNEQKYMLIALDGTSHVSSSKIKCPNCFTQTSESGVTTYLHKMFVGAVVSPKSRYGNIHLMPVCLDKTHGSAKQASEQKGFASFFESNQAFLKSISKKFKPIFLFDDLHTHKPQVSKLQELGHNFFGTCRPESHKYMNEILSGCTEKFSITISPQKFKEDQNYVQRPYGIYGKKLEKITITYAYAEKVPIRDDKEGEETLVNYISMEIYDPNIKTNEFEKEKASMIKKKQKKLKGPDKKKEIKLTDEEIAEADKKAEAKAHTNFSYATSFTPNKKNLPNLIHLARMRWKIENKSFHLLKAEGYNLDHNYGHGHNHFADLSAIVLLLAYNIFYLAYLNNHPFRNFVAKYPSMAKAIVAYFNILNTYVIPDFAAFEKIIDRHDKSFVNHFFKRGPPNPEGVPTQEFQIATKMTLEFRDGSTDCIEAPEGQVISGALFELEDLKLLK